MRTEPSGRSMAMSPVRVQSEGGAEGSTPTWTPWVRSEPGCPRGTDAPCWSTTLRETKGRGAPTEVAGSSEGRVWRKAPEVKGEEKVELKRTSGKAAFAEAR